jgi:hypothetical protein
MDRCVGAAAMLLGSDRKDLAIQALARSAMCSSQTGQIGEAVPVAPPAPIADPTESEKLSAMIGEQIRLRAVLLEVLMSVQSMQADIAACRANTEMKGVAP